MQIYDKIFKEKTYICQKQDGMDKTWTYYGAFLDDETRKQLLLRYKDLIADDWKLYCDHATLAFNDGTERSEEIAEYYKSMLGDEIELRIVGYGRSEETVALKLAPDYRTANKIFHITLATCPWGKPVKSNFITYWKPLHEVMTVKAKIGYFHKGKVNFNI